jgi:thioredoxin-related protein
MASGNVRAKIEFGLNIVIAVAILVIAGVVVKRAFSPQQANRKTLQQQAQSLLGTRINVPGANWEHNKKSLIFFLKKDCRYCEYIAPSYKQLIGEAKKRNIKLIAILPNSIEEAREYVQFLGLSIENVQTGALSSFKIPGTPSVLFVDSNGIVKSIWIGAEPGREKEMLDTMVALFNQN